MHKQNSGRLTMTSSILFFALLLNFFAAPAAAQKQTLFENKPFNAAEPENSRAEFREIRWFRKGK